jgi:hypothetical protein
MMKNIIVHELQLEYIKTTYFNNMLNRICVHNIKITNYFMLN